MRSLWSVCLFGVLLGCRGPAKAPGPLGPARPSIVLILADDMGFSDLGCYGSEIPTPRLDRLAAEGLRFTQFYNCARCCPTRASLLTGLYPHQAGIGHMIQDIDDPAYRGHLNDRCVTIAEALRETGYRTFLSGKWHVGETRPHWPVDRGFDRSFSLISGATSYFRLDPGRVLVDDDRPYVPPERGFYLTDAIADRAAGFIDAHGADPAPFFLYVAFTAPHWPLHAPPEDVARRRGAYREGWDALRERRRRRMVEAGIVDAGWALSPRARQAPAWDDVADPAASDLRMAVYAAQVERMDRGVGRILDALRRAGRDTDTLVMFLADNGGCAEEVNRGLPGAEIGGPESYASYGLPWAGLSNTPFRGFKHDAHEGGIATPLIVRWPAAVAPGGIVHAPGHVIDLLPTCLEAAGSAPPRTYRGRAVPPPEGVGLVSLLRGGAPPGERALFWEHEGNRAVRRGRWKLVGRFNGPWELYDLEDDRTETKDLAGAQPARVAELAGLYDEWAARCGVRPWMDIRLRLKETRGK